MEFAFVPQTPMMQDLNAYLVRHAQVLPVDFAEEFFKAQHREFSGPKIPVSAVLYEDPQAARRLKVLFVSKGYHAIIVSPNPIKGHTDAKALARWCKELTTTALITVKLPVKEYPRLQGWATSAGMGAFDNLMRTQPIISAIRPGTRSTFDPYDL